MKTKATVKTYGVITLFVAFLFGAAIAKLSYVVLSEEVDGVNLQEKSASITTATKTLYASRGSIFDSNGEKLASTVNSYKLIAYLSSTRTTNDKNPRHVVDKEKTAQELAPILEMDVETLLGYLNKDAYQVEFGAKGKGLTERVKKQIEALELPGIDFVTSTKRYYDMASFASYIVGYAKVSEEGEITGELGVEGFYNDILAGTNGQTTYQKYTSSNYQIPNTPSTTKKAKNGSDVYLTIDSSIQLIAEKAVSKYPEYDVEWALMAVMDAETGAIVASATYPNFDPNNTNTIKSYMNPLVSYQYEPGSVMKIFSWASAIEEKQYDGSETYSSGSIEVSDAVIRDANRTGWGTISFDTGFAYSSNVAATLLSKRLGASSLQNYYERLGFGSETGIELSNEVTGRVEIMRPTELANASFGQGISVTPVQMLQALSSMTNKGEVVKPYIVDKVVDADGKVTYKGERTVVDRVYKPETVLKMHELMHNVVYEGLTTMWQVPNVNVMGKTGTAQIASPQGGYLKGEYNNIKSFAGIFPADKPKYIIYTVAKQVHAAAKYFSMPVTTAIEEIASYAKLTENQENIIENKTVTIDNYISKETEGSVALLNEAKLKPIVIGKGKYVIDQYPLKGTNVLNGSKVFLLTNNEERIMPSIIGWSRSEVESLCTLSKVTCQFDGYGFVRESSVEEGSDILSDTVVSVLLE